MRWCRRGRGFVCMHFLERVCRDRVLLLLLAPRWPGRVWFPDMISLLDGPPLELTVRGLDISPQTRTVETVGLASEGAQLIDSGLSTEVVETILHSRAPSTRKLYALKWRVFTSWCSDHQLDPVNCPVGTVLEFLQERFTAGLAPSTLKVYVVAISAYHIPLGGISLGKDLRYLVSSVVLWCFCPDQERHNLFCSVQIKWTVKMNSCLYVLDLLIRGPLHLSKGWASGWSRPSHLLMSRPVNLLPCLSGPTQPGVWRPLRPLYQELLSKRFVMRQAGPHHTHSSDFILWIWTLPQVPTCSCPSAAH